jgi:hypothetical protein
MQIGHPVYSTIHATSSNELLRRVMDPIYQIPRTDINSLDLVLVMYHDLREKTRALIEVSEVTNAGLESETDIMANLYTYSPKAKTYIQISKPKKIFEKVQKKTGMSDEEVDRDMREKTMVLQWAMDNDITDMRQFEDVIQGYYSNRPQLLERIRASMKN